MVGVGIDGDGDGGGDDDIVMKLAGGVIREANVQGIGLCHWNGDGNVGSGGRVGDDEGDETIVGGAWDEMVVTTGGGMEIMEHKKVTEVELGEEGIESIPMGAGLLFFFLGD